MLEKIKAYIRRSGLDGGDVFSSVLCAFIVASVIFALGGDFRDLSYVRQYPLWIPIAVTAAVASSVLALSVVFKTKRIIAWGLILSTLAFAVILCITFPGNVFFCMGIALVLFFVAKYVSTEDKLISKNADLTDRHSFIIVTVLVVVFTIAVYFATAAKYKSFYHSAFDFGIFCQMFDSMLETGLPVTTVERSEELSHFAVHFSPIFYLLLPGYFVWRSPLYLLFCQAFAIALGAYPVRRICKSLGLSPLMSTGGAVLYLLFPTMANGCFYDFHENKLLTVLILWALAFALDKKWVPTGIFCFLVLTVKEDAFIYVLAICLWMLVTKRNRIFALCTAVFSILWFFFACNMIELSGGEIMTGRFANYSINGQGGLFDAVRTCIIDVGFLFKEVFAGADTEAFREMTYSGQKLEFVLWLCTPLLFTPFLRKRSSEIVLLVPLLVINLMPRWMYQFDVDFQYTYGTAALLIFSALLFLGERGERMRRFVLCAGICIALVFCVSLVYPKAENYISSYYGHRDDYMATAKALEEIPEDASVTAYGYMVPHLWYVDTLRTCPEYYKEMEKTDYYVVDTRYEYDGHTKKMYDAMGEDYSLVCEKGYVKIFKLKDSYGR